MQTGMRWSPADKIKLALLYHMGASQHEISHIFGKTQSAISKQLTCFGAIQKGVERRPCRIFPEKCQISVIQKVYEHTLQEHRFFLNTSFAHAKRHLQKVFPLQVLEQHQKKDERVPESLRHLEPWVSLEEITKFLGQRNIKIVKAVDTPTWKKAGVTHLVNGVPRTPSQILLEANRIAVALGLPKFYVSGLTEENN
jgi:hypothetical protein